MCIPFTTSRCLKPTFWHCDGVWVCLFVGMIFLEVSSRSNLLVIWACHNHWLFLPRTSVSRDPEHVLFHITVCVCARDLAALLHQFHDFVFPMSLFPGINDKARACKRSRAERAKLGQIFTKIQEVSIQLFCLIQIHMTSALSWRLQSEVKKDILNLYNLSGVLSVRTTCCYCCTATNRLQQESCWIKRFFGCQKILYRSCEKNHLVLDHGCTKMMTWLPCWKFALMWMIQCDIHGSWYWLHFSLISGGMWSKGRAMWRRRRHILPFHRLSNPARFAKPSPVTS